MDDVGDGGGFELKTECKSRRKLSGSDQRIGSVDPQPKMQEHRVICRNSTSN